jgi:bifunctional non-homologous end joining protein LigD
VARVAGIHLTHADRVLYPEQGVTKASLAQYYRLVADWMLPHVARRPLALVRCPSGRGGPCFYQKHVGEGWPDAIHGVEIEEVQGKVQWHAAIDDAAGLVALVQFGVLEIHPWGAREDRVDRPDRLIIDLDPGPGVEWKEVQRGALAVRDVLAEAGLESFPRTTGGKGLHVVTPIERRVEWDELKAFAGLVSDRVRRREPGRYVLTVTKSKRAGKILLDYFRNGFGATSIASYSSRARPGAPVAVNLGWDELDQVASSDAWNVTTLPHRLAALDGDPWAGFFDVRQAITKAAWSRLERA